MSRSITAADRRHLIRLAATLRKGSPLRRSVLSGLRLAEEEGGGKGGGKGGGPGKALMKFLEEVGDQKTKNPDTGNEVKVKTLSSAPKDSKAYKLFQDQFDKWKKQQEKGEEKDKGGGDALSEKGVSDALAAAHEEHDSMYAGDQAKQISYYRVKEFWGL